MTQLHIFESEVTDPELPKRALTVWQPWAWLLVHGHKPVENRPPGFSQKSFRGWFWIHAGQKASLEEWLIAREICRQYGFHDLPAFADMEALPYGAIIGGAASPESSRPMLSQRCRGTFPINTVSCLPTRRRSGRPCLAGVTRPSWHVPTPVLAELKAAA